MSIKKPNKTDGLPNKIVKSIKIEHSGCNRAVRDGKVVLSKASEKTYTVTVTYIQISDEEAKSKRAQIEGILRRGYIPKDV